jgi:hypothetical protein
MNSDEKQVLDMLARGTITADEAERLLERLRGPATGADAPQSGAGPSSTGATAGAATAAAESRGSGAAPKFLRITVDSTDGDKVNIRVPLELVRTGIQLGAMLPSEAREKLDARGIDISKLGGMEGERLVEALRELTVDVDSAKGDRVHIFCE